MKSTRVLLPFLLLALPACGGGLTGTYVNASDPEDRLELQGGTGCVAALRGQNLDVWHPPAARGGGLVAELGAAQRAMRQVEMVEVQVTPAGDGMLRLSADGRGSRVLRVDPRSDAILTGGLRKYFRQ